MYRYRYRPPKNGIICTCVVRWARIKQPINQPLCLLPRLICDDRFRRSEILVFSEKRRDENRWDSRGMRIAKYSGGGNSDLTITAAFALGNSRYWDGASLCVRLEISKSQARGEIALEREHLFVWLRRDNCPLRYCFLSLSVSVKSFSFCFSLSLSVISA